MSGTLQSAPILQSALQRLSEGPYLDLVTEIRRGARAISISGLVSEPARALALVALQRETRKQFAIVSQANRDLESWERDLRFWYCALSGKTACEEEVLILPSSESDPYA